MPNLSADAQSESSGAEPRRSARDRIFAAARDLFYRQGIRAVGVESIAQEAGATKMSLYRAFSSKDELVAECLKQSECDAWAWWDATVSQHPTDPRAAVLALFDGLCAKAQTCEQRGCAIGNAAVELTDDAHPGRAVVLGYNREKRRRLRELCTAMGARDPEVLADGLQLLMDGAYMSRQNMGCNGPNASMRRNAEALISAYL